MKISRLKIRNFRGIRRADLLFPDHVVLIGDNNTGKSTVLDSIDLVLGPDRLNRRAPIDEHDFFQGRYLPGAAIYATTTAASAPPEEGTTEPSDNEGEPVAQAEREPPQGTGLEPADDPPQICVEVTITDLSSEQSAHFKDYVEWWNTEGGQLYTDASVQGVDADTVVEALRVTFIGQYVAEEDDFEGRTYFARSLKESDNPQPFSRRDKQYCGFLYLRGLRTGRRALSLEHGSLLDVILRLKEIRPRLWETTIGGLAEFDVASDPDLGISGVLESINAALNKYVPKEWGVKPHLRVSALTRDHLRNVITAFIATGEGSHSAPFYRQGTGTINMLVLAMLSQIAEDRQNVIFAMEEPETAIPPYAQKRIVHELRKLSAQSIFTSHSPYVLEEFELHETVVLARASDGELSQAPIALPNSVKHKRYRQEFRTRFCEGLLSRRVLVAEGAVEASAFPAVARRLAELAPAKYSSLEALGICTIDAGSQTRIPDLGGFYRSLGKTVYGLCDKQSAADQAKITANVDELFMHSEKGIEDLVLKNTTTAALDRFAGLVDWPQHLNDQYPNPKEDVEAALNDYFRWSKGSWGIADFLSQCTEEEIPEWLRDCCVRLRQLAQPVVEEPPSVGK
ncbi:MAG: AAA family ATPase [Gammaproteobacteria bacterium]|nr:AAA family ATPase [Gammaproteobacteria bacterium]MYK81410.1 AAA family ATPase [Gammaproteobacteria bacterium]